MHAHTASDGTRSKRRVPAGFSVNLLRTAGGVFNPLDSLSFLMAAAACATLVNSFGVFSTASTHSVWIVMGVSALVGAIIDCGGPHLAPAATSPGRAQPEAVRLVAAGGHRQRIIPPHFQGAFRIIPQLVH